MKFTDGYWLRKENVQASYAAQAFTVEEIPHGMRIAAPERPIRTRADSLDITVLYIDIISAAHNDIAVSITHYAGYDSKEPRFELNMAPGIKAGADDSGTAAGLDSATGCDIVAVPDKVSVSIDEKEAVMTAGDITVRVTRDPFAISYEAGGKVLTGSAFRNIGYMRVDKKPTKLRMDPHYFEQDYAPYMSSELSVKPGETIYGFGERFTPFVKNGQTVNIWNEDGGTASDISYKNIPFYMSSENYGVFVDHSGPVSFEVCSEKVEDVGVSVPGEQLRYHIMYGRTPAEVIEVYTALTGRPALPPAWSFGLWLSSCFKPSYDEETVSKMIDGMQERDIPFRVFHIDCYWMRAFHWCDFTWDPAVFADVRGMIDRYHNKGIKICCWINPYVAQDTDMFREGSKRGYFLMRADGRGVKQVDNWQPGLSVVDFTNPEACKWYAGKVQGLLDAGVDAIKTDFGERIPIDVTYHDGSDPMMMHNYYTFLYNKLVFTTLEKAKGKGNAVLFARSATAGSQRFPIHWGGDCEATYGSMTETIHAGLSFAMSGFSFWSHDISGFEKTATPDLYKRWAQFGLFSTHSRLHGSETYRVPWLFDEESVDVVRFFSRLKCTLMPYYYRMAEISHETGIPVMRPMPFAFPGDRACQYLDLQYMIGDSILVAPIVNDDSVGEFYLPDCGEGNKDRCCRWIGLIDGEVLEGGRWYKKKYDYMNLPVFVRENSLIAVGAHSDVPDYDYTDGTTLRLYLPKETAAGCQCEIPDLTGRTVVKAYAVRNGSKVTLHIDGSLKNAQYEVYLEDGRKLEGAITGAETVITL